MKVTKEQLDTIKVKFTIEVDDDKFEEAVERVYRDQVKKIKVDGFRKGKAPRKIIENVYGKEVFYGDAVETLIPYSYIEAVKSLDEAEQVTPIARPEFDIVQLEAGKPFIFSALVEVKQDINIENYKGIELEKIEEEVTEEELNTYFDDVRKKHAVIDVLDDADATLMFRDIAVIDFVGKKDGVAFEGGTGKDYPLEIGSNSFIPGFEDQMLGMKKGETKDLELSFPENYHEPSLAGQPVVFEVTVNEIKRQTLPELDDEFAKDVSEFETFEEYKASVVAELNVQKKEYVDMQYKATLSNKVVEMSDVITPDSLLESEKEAVLNELRYSLSQQGFSLEQYVQLTGANMDDIEAEAKERAEGRVKQRLVIEAIAEKEGIEVTEEEMDIEFGKLAEMYQQPIETVKQVFTMQGQTENDRRNAIMEKTMAMLLENAKIG